MDRKNKIESIHIDDEMLKDPKMDEFLRKSIMEEADRIEKELNEDPSLQGVSAPDDMFEKIKAQLQEEGVWEEDEEKENQERETTEREQTEEITDRDEKEIESGTKIAVEQDVYSLLSKEDRQALELGKKIKRNRKRKWKQLAGAAVIVLVVFSVGISGEASRRWMLDAWDKLVNIVGSNILTDYIGEGEKSISMPNISKEEENAWKEIKKELEVPIIWFNYMPQEMEFANYSVLKNTNEAFLFYFYKDSIISVRILTGDIKETAYLQSDIEPLLVEKIKNDQEILIKLWDTSTKGIASYMADFEYQDCIFVCSGTIEYQEFKKIMEYMEII